MPLPLSFLLGEQGSENRRRLKNPFPDEKAGLSTGPGIASLQLHRKLTVFRPSQQLPSHIAGSEQRPISRYRPTTKERAGFDKFLPLVPGIKEKTEGKRLLLIVTFSLKRYVRR